MKILNMGSLNIDYVYDVDHIILPGETEATYGRNIFLGGKGINQSIALAKAGANVFHAGIIGEDGHIFLDACNKYGVNDKFIREVEGPSGHTIIQIDKNAQNSILLFGGANHKFTKEYVDEVLKKFNKGDYLLLQNEVNLLPYMVDKAYEKEMIIVFNPSPFNERIYNVDLKKISIFLLNEIEGKQITGQSNPNRILNKMQEMFPKAKIVLTCGEDGATYADEKNVIHQPIYKVKAIDTTAAGDTFTGYFIAGMMEGKNISELLRISAKAASIAVTRKGAVNSIPNKEEVINALE